MIDPENLGMALSDRKVSLLFDIVRLKCNFRQWRNLIYIFLPTQIV